MATVYLGLGSNLEKEHYIPLGVAALAQLDPQIQCSKVYASEAIGFAGPAFYNLVVKIESSQSLAALYDTLKAIEQAHGRTMAPQKVPLHTLDIDILLYDDVCTEWPCIIPRPDICQYAFVLRPLSELAPDLIHPTCHTPVKRLWKDFDQQAQPLCEVAITLYQGCTDDNI